VYNRPRRGHEELAVHARVSSYEGDVDRLVDSYELALEIEP
jgi:hypothetical protein